MAWSPRAHRAGGWAGALLGGNCFLVVLGAGWWRTGAHGWAACAWGLYALAALVGFALFRWTEAGRCPLKWAMAGLVAGTGVCAAALVEVALRAGVSLRDTGGALEPVLPWILLAAYWGVAAVLWLAVPMHIPVGTRDAAESAP